MLKAPHKPSYDRTSVRGTQHKLLLCHQPQGKPQEAHPASENLEDKTLLGHEALRKSWSHLVSEDAGERGAPPGREQHLWVFMSSPQHTWALLRAGEMGSALARGATALQLLTSRGEKDR